MIVRPANTFDACQILALLVEMHAEATAPLSPINAEKALTRIVNAIHRGVVLVALSDDQKALMGSVGGICTVDWYGDAEFLGDLWFYVRREHRSSRAALALMRRFRDAAKQMRVPLRMAVFNGNDVERKDRFFERVGFRKVGGFYTEA